MENLNPTTDSGAVLKDWFVASSEISRIVAQSFGMRRTFVDAAKVLGRFGPLSVAVMVRIDDDILHVFSDGFSTDFRSDLEQRNRAGHRLSAPMTSDSGTASTDPIVAAFDREGINRYSASPLVSAGRDVGEIFIGVSNADGHISLPPAAIMDTIANTLALSIEHDLLVRKKEARDESNKWHETLLNAIVRGRTDAVMVTDSLGRVSLLNPAGEVLLGVLESEVLGNRLSDLDTRLAELGHPEDAFDASHERITIVPGTTDVRQIEGIRIASFEYDGRAYVVWNVGHADNGQSRISEQESRLSALVNNDRLAVFYCDQNGEVNSRNSTLLKLLGMEEGDIAEGSNISDSAALTQSGITAKVNECIETGNALVSSHDVVHPRRGTLHLTGHFSPIVLADGVRIGVQGILEDATDYIKTRTSLVQSEERYRVFFRNAPISLLEVDFSDLVGRMGDSGSSDTRIPSSAGSAMVSAGDPSSYPMRISAANPAAVLMYGAASESALVSTWSAGLNRISELQLSRMIKSFTNGDPAYRYETVHRTMSGKFIHVSVSAAVAAGHESDFSRVLLSIQDITPLKAMEATLKSQLVLERLVSTISSRFLSLQPERTGDGIDLVVKEAGKSLGATVVAVLEFHGKTLSPTHVWSVSGADSAEQSVTRYVNDRFSVFSAPLSKWKSVNINDMGEASRSLQIEFQNSTGLRSLLLIPLVAQERVKGAILFASRTKPEQWVDESDALLRILSDVVANALDRQQREKLRRQSEDLLRTVFHSMAGGLIVADPGGRILLANPSASKNFRLEWPNQIIGRKIGELARGAEGMLKNSHPGAQQQIVLLLTDGTKRTFGFSSASAASGQRIIVFRDLTKMLEADTRQKRAEELARLGMVVAKLSHEIKNPIASILLGLRGLEDSEALSDEDRYILTSVLEEVRFLKSFVGDLLDATRFQETSPKLEDVAPLLDAVMETQKRVAKRANIQIHLVAGDPDTTACIDKNAMIRALGNLVKNAIEACAPHHTVSLGWRDMSREDISRRLPGYNGDTLCIFVEDTGPGMPKEVMENLFTPFTTTKMRGNGLGLSLVRETVAGHGGVIEVITPINDDGGGTRFEILIAKGDRASCLDFHGNCKDGCLTCPMPEGCPVRELESFRTCWVAKGRASLKETGRWNEECMTCPVFLHGNLEHFYLGPSYRKEGP